MATTYFTAQLKCLHCGQLGTASIESDLDDRGKTYEVGARYDDRIGVADFNVSCLRVQQPDEDKPIHGLFSWTCTHCGKASFAEIVFADGLVTWIDGVELDPEVLARVHYISRDSEELLRPIVDEPLYTDGELRPDWLPRLRDGLAAGRRW